MSYRFTPNQETDRKQAEIRPGWHAAHIEAIDQKQTKAGDHMLVVRYRLADVGEAVWQHLCVGHSRRTVADIAIQQLTYIHTSCGYDVSRPGDTDLYLGKTLEIKVALEADGPYKGSPRVEAVRKSQAPDGGVSQHSFGADFGDEEIPF